MATLTENIETLKSTINAEKSIIEDYDGPVPEGTNISTYEEKVRNIIKGRRHIANSVPSDVELDIDNITTEVANKADKTEVANKAMPSDKYVDVPFSQGTYYVAPSDGYFTISGYGSATPISIALKDSNDSIILLVSSVLGAVESDRIMGVTMPMRKGQIAYMYYYNGTISGCRFVYAEGNKP